MKKVPGLEEAFKNAKIVWLTTFDEKGDEVDRQMTNYNEDPYVEMWFPTWTDTRKVRHLKRRPDALLTFPAEEEDKYYRIQGTVRLADEETTYEKWRWWYLSWVPGDGSKYGLTGSHGWDNRAILLFTPELAFKLDKPG
jgi:general stress protein 26